MKPRSSISGVEKTDQSHLNNSVTWLMRLVNFLSEILDRFLTLWTRGLGPISPTSVRLTDGQFQWNYPIAFVFDQNEPITVDTLPTLIKLAL